MHLAPLIRDLAMILGVGGLVTLVFHRIRQPVVLGYILAGFFVGPYFPPFPVVKDLPNIRIWAEIGLVFLMFTLGLEFSFRKLLKVGISAGVTALFEVSAMMGLGFLTGRLLGWKLIDCMFLGAMVGISSTTIILKALDELKLKVRRFAQLIFGVLIVEDLVAILVLVLLSTVVTTNQFSGLVLLFAVGKLILVIGSWFLTGYFVVPRFMRYVGKFGSEETLTILSLGLCFAFVVLASQFHYSVALGAFIAGSILAESPESQRIEEQIVPLRDLFSAIFFVSVGMLIDPYILMKHFWTVLLFSAIVIVGKTTFATIGALLSGQTLRTSMQVGLGLAQIGEFSFIIATLGLKLGAISDHLFPVAVAVSLVTTFSTPYCIRFSHDLAVALEGRLPLRIKDGLARYAAWVQERRLQAAERSYFYRLLFRWLLNALCVTVVFILVSEFVMPIVAQYLSGIATPAVISWLIAMLCSAPFAWAMFSTFNPFARRNLGLYVLFRLLTFLLVGGLSVTYFPEKYAFISSGVLLFLFFVFFYRYISQSYQWFERIFLSTFEMPQKEYKVAESDITKHLAPWDAHLVRLKVHPNSQLVGKRLIDAKLRTEYGLNVVVIHRGVEVIVAPKPQESIYPKDELLVLGTDEQIEMMRSAIEKPPGLEKRFKDNLSGYDLRSFLVGPSSSLIGQTIRASSIRETYHCMVVGIERDQKRMMNPDSDLVIQPNDTLWVVGEAEQIQLLSAQHAS